MYAEHWDTGEQHQHPEGDVNVSSPILPASSSQRHSEDSQMLNSCPYLWKKAAVSHGF